MGLIIRTMLSVVLVISVASIANAAWQGPTEILTGLWGNDVKQFGIEHGDSGDDFPFIEAITPDNKIIISDIVNKKQMIYGLDGSFIKEVKWVIKSQSGGRTYYDIAEYSFGPVVGYSADGNIYTGSGNKYFLKSPTGQLIKTSTTRPLELGVANSQKIKRGQYRSTVKYPDIVYQFKSEQPIKKYCRDQNHNLYITRSFTTIVEPATTEEEEDKSILTYQVDKYNRCSKKVSTLDLVPLQSQGMPLGVQYGQPIIAADGNIYTWKRSDTTYSILKWTWVDDPSVPTGPDAPTGLSVAASINGLYLTWTASPNDPGCVTGYEISRATSAGGVFSTIATVDKGVVKYNDTTAEAGTTYYYKVRAKAGAEYSPYSSEASGKR